MNLSDRRRLLVFWGICFLYVIGTGLAVQLLLLPKVFPSWDSGSGMLVRTDSGMFHELALGLAGRIDREGWSAWQLRPNGQAPAGIAAAVYVLTWPEPWTLLPLNGVLHASAAVLLVLIMRRFVAWRSAFLVSLPFTFYPSALRWTAQIHKDGMTILGFYLFAYSLLALTESDLWNRRWGRSLKHALLGLAGVALIWIMRPYLALMLQVAAFVPSLLVAGYLLRKGWKGEIPRLRSWLGAALVVAILAAMTVFSTGGDERVGGDLPGPASTPPPKLDWRSLGWMPSPLDRVLRSVANRRLRYTTAFPEAGSNIDEQVVFHDPLGILLYVPRAAEIALLSPFPADWLAAGTLPSTTAMRRLAGFEMVGIYLALLMLPLAMWQWRSRIDAWLLLFLCLALLVGYGLVVANVGTLYRMRYPYIMLLVALGLGGAASWWRARRDRGPSGTPLGSPPEGP